MLAVVQAPGRKQHVVADAAVEPVLALHVEAVAVDVVVGANEVHGHFVRQPDLGPSPAADRGVVEVAVVAVDAAVDPSPGSVRNRDADFGVEAAHRLLEQCRVGEDEPISGEPLHAGLAEKAEVLGVVADDEVAVGPEVDVAVQGLHAGGDLAVVVAEDRLPVVVADPAAEHAGAGLAS